MKKYISVIPVVIIIIAGVLFAQNQQKINFETSWKKVNELADKQLPESALKEVEEIQKQAELDKNSVQLIKALIYKMRFALEKDRDDAPKLIREFELNADKATDPAEKALLKSMTAELYADYYQNNSWTINNRSEISGYVPEDINEWSKNIYFEKINKLLDASLENKAVLQKTNALKFSELLNEGEDSKELQPTVFDFLSYRKIDILTTLLNLNNQNVEIKKEIEITFDNLIKFAESINNVPSLIFSKLKHLTFIQNQSGYKKNDLIYLNALNELENKYENNEDVVEVMAQKANYFLIESTVENTKNDFKKRAYELCSNGIKKFPTYKRIDLLRNIQKQITQKTLSVSHNDVSTPESNLEISIRYNNISDIRMNIYRLDASAQEFMEFKDNRRKVDEKFPKRTLQQTKEFELKPDLNFNTKDTTVALKTGKYGIYEVNVSEKGNDNPNEVSTSYFVVTELVAMNRSVEVANQSWYVLNRITGFQQNHVKVRAYERKWTGNGYRLTLINDSETDKNGFTSYNCATNHNQILLILEKGEDRYYSPSSYAYFIDNKQKVKSPKRLNLFTDRSLYRPGQTVYFKGIAYYSSKEQNEIIKNESFEITLYNANNQPVSTKKFNTNDFGSFAGEFVLPESGLNGTYRITWGNTSQHFWVEEYKRPTFEVKIEKPKLEVKFGEKINLSGNVKAFAGYNVASAKVNYRVVRTTYRLCWWNIEPETELLNGAAVTDSDGNFSFTFVPEKSGESDRTWRGQFYTYKIYAEVTDTKGETQQGENSFTVGDKSLFIVATVASKIEKHTPTSINIIVQTLNDEVLKQEVDYEVYKLKEPLGFVEDLKKDYEAKLSEKMLVGKFNTADKNLVLKLDKFRSGSYKLVLRTKDVWGNEVKTEQSFIVYGKDESRPAVKTYEWLLQNEIDCVVGEVAQVRFGSSAHNVKVLVELMLGNKILESKWVTICNTIKTFKFPYKESYGAGVRLNFTFVKNERFFCQQVAIKRKVQEKKLIPTLTVFRDKLQPGEKAEWTITIPELKNTNKTAEVLIAMYDASLDKIRPHRWSFNPVYREIVLGSPQWGCTMNYSKTNDYVQFENPMNEIFDFKLNYLNWFGLVIAQPNYGGPIKIRGSRSDVLMSESITATAISAKSTGQIAETEDKLGFYIREVPKEKTLEPVQLRTNFNETAFFYPQLRTDSTGNVKFSFTVPESLTRWDIKMLAHTQDLYFGQNEAQVVTQKDLMIQLNLPRFVRRSDKLVLAANVINLTDKELNANVSLEVINPETEKVVFAKTSHLSLGRGAGGEVVEFEISDFSSYELLVCKVVAKAGNFSDGEQRYLPVLPDKVLVTESMPMTVRGNQTRTFNFESLIKNSSKVETQNLSLEFSSNPAWYAVQALPTLSTPESNNALDYFTAFYVNSLAGFIANSNPKIASVFQQWKQTESGREALLSNLQKNSELKNMLLEETPWVVAAKDETEQKKQIALLFDLNMQKNQRELYLNKLWKLQTPNGGFSWFEGMPESRYITQEILLNFARLDNMTKAGLRTAHKVQLAQALNYLDLEISKDFSNLKKYNKNYLKENCIGNIQLFYLHVRSEYPDVSVNENAQEAFKYYTAQSEKYWTSFTLYGKAMMAVVAKRNGNMKVANEILKSLKENALKTDEFGMYWARNKSGYFWNERPIAVQAAIIEAFVEISKNKSDIEEMKIWLLKQKQTQRWDSPISSVNAIYALMLQGDNWLNNEGKVQISVGGKTITTETSEAGTGYFKQSLPTDNITSSTGKVTVQKTDAGIAWGAMYWQYYQDLDKIEGQGKELKVSKKLFVEKIISNKKTMIPIEQTTLTRGDKILTRLVVTTDRNLEFVALKDLRASCLEPVDQRSACEWKESVCYYRTTKDASTQFFFSYLPKGTYVFEYESWANNSGEFTSGIASIQCQYAPEFVSHTDGEKFEVK